MTDNEFRHARITFLQQGDISHDLAALLRRGRPAPGPFWRAFTDALCDGALGERLGRGRVRRVDLRSPTWQRPACPPLSTNARRRHPWAASPRSSDGCTPSTRKPERTDAYKSFWTRARDAAPLDLSSPSPLDQTASSTSSGNSAPKATSPRGREMRSSSLPMRGAWGIRDGPLSRRRKEAFACVECDELLRFVTRPIHAAGHGLILSRDRFGRWGVDRSRTEHRGNARRDGAPGARHRKTWSRTCTLRGWLVPF